MPDRSDLAVSIFVPGKYRTGDVAFPGAADLLHLPPGDFTASTEMPVSATTQARFWLAGVDVAASGTLG